MTKRPLADQMRDLTIESGNKKKRDEDAKRLAEGRKWEQTQHKIASEIIAGLPKAIRAAAKEGENYVSTGVIFDYFRYRGFTSARDLISRWAHENGFKTGSYKWRGADDCPEETHQTIEC